MLCKLKVELSLLYLLQTNGIKEFLIQTLKIHMDLSLSNLHGKKEWLKDKEIFKQEDLSQLNLL
jgi:hypothetical protein